MGKAFHPDVQYGKLVSDDSFENISQKYPSYAELTVLYWGWKNYSFLKGMGLVRANRYLSLSSNPTVVSVLSQSQLRALLKHNDIILAERSRSIFETNEFRYKRIQHGQPLTAIRKIIWARYPSYAEALKTVLQRKWLHRYNLLFMKHHPLDEYCTWLFDILTQLERYTDDAGTEHLSSQFAELLLDVWLTRNTQYRVKEIPTIVLKLKNNGLLTK